jgi:hypothetical protein
MILSALESQKPAVIVLSKHDVFGLLDEIIWTGGREQIYRPLGPYIMSEYSIDKTIEYDGKRWEIWSYSPGSSQELNVFFDQVGSLQVGTQSVGVTFGFQNTSASYSSKTFIDSYIPALQSSAMSIDYTFLREKQAFVRRTIDFHDTVNLANYNSISLWVEGDNSTNNLWVDLKDDNGRELGIVAANLNFLGWKNVLVSISDFAKQDVNTAAIRQLRISIDNNARNLGSGNVTLAHLALLS